LGKSANVPHDIIVIGGSSGALEAMVDVVAGLPADYPGALFLVSHIGANPSKLPELLAESTRLRASHARHEEEVLPGRIYVAPPDRHMMLDGRRIMLSSAPREHFTRPAIDPLFRSAARNYGARVAGVVLSGAGSDGAAGLVQVSCAGGLTIVQDPDEAPFPEMPETSLRATRVDYVLRSAEISPVLRRLAEGAAAMKQASRTRLQGTGIEFEEPVALTCPECGGAIREEAGTGLLTYRCHTGHRFSADELLTCQRADVERAAMVVIRVLHERTTLCQRMIRDASNAGRAHGVAYWMRLKDEADEQLRVLQHFLRHADEDREKAEPALAETAAQK